LSFQILLSVKTAAAPVVSDAGSYCSSRHRLLLQAGEFRTVIVKVVKLLILAKGWAF
jgi:hypothetical protein